MQNRKLTAHMMSDMPSASDCFNISLTAPHIQLINLSIKCTHGCSQPIWEQAQLAFLEWILDERRKEGERVPVYMQITQKFIHTLEFNSIKDISCKLYNWFTDALAE